jgi:hypothetical protein
MNTSAKQIDGSGTPVIDHKRRDTILLIGGAIGVQILGVTAALVGQRTLPQIANHWYTNTFIIVMCAYGLSIPMIGLLIAAAVRANPLRPRTVLLWIYCLFITADTVCLGWLVYYSGGTRTSLFMPLFVLIPAVTTCYCDPRISRPYHKNWKNGFWANLVLVGGVLMFISYFGRESAEATGPKGHQADVLTVICILTAGFCHLATDSVRKGACSRKHDPVCPELYL